MAICGIYNKIHNSAYFDQGQRSKTSMVIECVDLPNCKNYTSVIPVGKDGADDDLVMRFNPASYLHKSTGMFLKATWFKMRLK